jgi:mannosidase alpha-like ER degradation enhancer 1
MNLLKLEFKNVTVQVFEVTIRVLGSLLSTHQLLVVYTDPMHKLHQNWDFKYDNELLIMAHDLGKRLLPAFETEFGLPFPRVNLGTGVDPDEIKEACVAGAGTLLLEFGTLSKLTGDTRFEMVAQRALYEIYSRKSSIDLLGNTMKLNSREWVETYSGIGAGMDSFYEYLLKSYILFDNDEYYYMFLELYQAIMVHIRTEDGYIYKNVDMNTGKLRAGWIDSLAAYFIGLQVLAGDIDNAIKPFAVYERLWKRYGAIPERWNFQTREAEMKIYPLRPEFIESTYSLYRVL